MYAVVEARLEAYLDQDILNIQRAKMTIRPLQKVSVGQVSRFHGCTLFLLLHHKD